MAESRRLEPEETRSEPAATTTRRLSAIMFSDMAGYTALVQQDEPRARRARNRWRSVLDRQTTINGGRVLQFFGDGALCVFDSAIAAVSSAVAIQKELSGEASVPVRIGIHTGDIIYDDEGVFGDGVNIAARIQNMGTPGTVLVSAKVFDEIKNQPQLSAISLGEFNLKNVQRPLEVFAVSAEGLALPDPAALHGRAVPTRRSVAVLPFVNVSPDPENEFFTDGMTEELINLLTRVNGLQVTARTSSFAFKGRQQDVRRTAAELGVEMVLEGSVRKAGERVRITAQLIDASSGYHVFSETYNRQLNDIFELQDEIARAIVSVVENRLTPRFSGGPWAARLDSLNAFLASRRTSPEAHALYLHGLHEFNKWTPEALRRALDLLGQCVTADPEYAPAHAALARAHSFRGLTGQADPESSWRAAESAAQRAVELDPLLGDAHIALATCALFHQWDATATYEHLQKGLSLNPGSALVHHTFGMYHMVTGDYERSVEEMEEAVRLDPLSMLMHYSLASALNEAGRFDEAIVVSERILATDPMFRAAYEAKGFALLGLGRLDEAARQFDRVVEITGDPYKGLASRGFNFARMGRTDDARRMLEMLHERAARHPEQSLEFDFVILHAGLGEYDQAFSYLEAAARKRLAEVLGSVNSPMWRELRRDPRYWDIIERCGLASFARERSVS
jgi:TolB-like protein/Tfp pilus assembly protein PilF